MPMATAPLSKIERAHQMYREGVYLEALRFYTEALAMATTLPQRISLHSNRAACHLKLHDFKKVNLSRTNNSPLFNLGICVHVLIPDEQFLLLLLRY